MRYFVKSFAVFVAWTYLLTCLAPYSPCYAMDDEKIEAPLSVKLSSGDVDLESALPAQQNSWKTKLKAVYEVPLLFVSTLFCSETDLKKAGQFYKQKGKNALGAVQEELVQVGEEGLLPYAGSKVVSLLKGAWSYPYETMTYVGGALVGWTNVGETLPFLAPTLTTISNIKAGLNLVPCLPLPKGRKLVSTVMTLVTAAGIVYLVSQLPGVGAHEFNSVDQAKQHYSGGPCPHNPWGELMTPASTCLRDGGSLEKCQALIPLGKTHTDLYAFTRHPTKVAELDPVSVLKLHEGGKTCIQTALKPTDPVTESCFPDASNPAVRTVRAIEGLQLAQAHQGLASGKTVRHIGLQVIESRAECGTFHETSAPYDLGDEATCLLTSLKSGGDVTQICFDPKHPEVLTLKRNDDVDLTFDDSDGKPFSLVIRKPQEKGLNIGPDVPSLPEGGSVKTQPTPDLPCPNESEGLSLWGAIKLWWSGKPPCAKDEL